MLRVIGTIIREHNPGVAGLACIVCLLAVGTAARLLGASSAQPRRQRVAYLAAATVAFSAGICISHFIGILAFKPDVPFGFDVARCVAALVPMVAATAAAFGLSTSRIPTPGRLPLQAAILTAGIAAMQVAGLHGLLLPGRLTFHPAAMACSDLLGFGLAALGFWLNGRGQALLSALPLSVGALTMHFLGLHAVSLELTPHLALPTGTLPHPVLLAATAAGCLVIVLLAVGASVLDQHASSRLAVEARRFRTLADATFEGLILEKHGRIVDTNKVMGELAGLHPGQLIGRDLHGLMPGLSLNQAPAGRAAELVVRRADGGSRPVEVLWKSDAENGGHVVAVRDLSRQKAAESMIDRLARLDPLTGLLNRATFEQHADQALLPADQPLRGLAVLHIGLDRLDMLTEVIGAAAIEQLMIQITQRLNGAVRPSDTVGQLGRDEFAVLQAPINQPAEAAALAERILLDLSRAFSIGDQPVSVAVGIGVALYPQDGASGRELIRNAALASHQARQQTKNRWGFHEAGMNEKVRERRLMQRDLRNALAGGQFTLHYQPFVDANTLHITGYEALLRWDHPERGRIPPIDFIPVAEESGLILPIGNWVLATACAEAASWRRPAVLAVNLSPVQFNQPGLPAIVASVLRQTGLPAERLELEVTESTLVADKQKVLETLKALKALGVRIAMDDFGTGYSSLSTLRTFPFDKLKIDRSFVKDVEHDAEAESIVQAIIAMAAALRLRITAEGVETRDQLALLRAYGCHYLQGYLLGRPRQASQLEDHVDTAVVSAMARPLPTATIAAPRGVSARQRLAENLLRS